MGLDDFAKTDTSPGRFKKYSMDEEDAIAEEIADEFRDELPDNFQMAFIEASPAMKGGKSWIYHRTIGDEDVFFIRVGEAIFYEDREYIERRIQLAMVRLYAFQQDILVNDEEDTNEDHQERAMMWMLGRLGIDAKTFYINHPLWYNTCEHFMEDE